MITVQLVTRAAGEATVVATLVGQVVVPRKGEVVTLVQGESRRFQVEEIAWRYSGAMLGDHADVELTVQEICRTCVRPVWRADDPDYPTCRRCAADAADSA